jgi:hypothetical protein
MLGLVLNQQQVLNDEGRVVSEVMLRKDTERRIINMDKTHHDLSITGDKGCPRAISYHNPAFQRGQQEARSLQGTSLDLLQPTPQERHCHHSTYSIGVQS